MVRKQRDFSIHQVTTLPKYIITDKKGDIIVRGNNRKEFMRNRAIWMEQNKIGKKFRK